MFARYELTRRRECLQNVGQELLHRLKGVFAKAVIVHNKKSNSETRNC